jgi:phosphatidylglycerol:prolipoprotein diacylglycerol transferase
MIPYFSWQTFHLGPIPIQVWGLFVALGILAGTWAAARLARRRRLDPSVVWDATVWIVVAAMVGARLFHVVVYVPTYYLADPWQILAVWNGGLSMFGGFICAVAAGLWFLQRRKLALLAYCDTLAYGLPLGIGIGRIGCFLIHDHPGTLTHFLLGVRFADGSVRHDLGLYESIYGFALAIVFYVLFRSNAKPSTYLATFLITYGLFRFAADFLRVIDTRYLGLTPAQFLSVLMVLAGILLSLREVIRRSNPPRGIASLRSQ